METRKGRVAIIGGFSEKAKDFLLANALRKISITNPHSGVLVIRDHIEAVHGIDDMDERTHVEIEYLCGGCFCCTLKSDFEYLLKEYANRSGSWYLLIEAPLIADVGVIEGSIKHILGNDLKIEKVFTIEAETIDVLSVTFPDLFNRNINQADILAISGSTHQRDNPFNRLPERLKNLPWQGVGNIKSIESDLTLFARKGKKIGFFFD